MTAVTSGNIPVGITDFEKLRNMNAVYIDKTSFLNSLLTSSIEVFLLLRPRRFGKSYRRRIPQARSYAESDAQLYKQEQIAVGSRKARVL